MLNNIRPVVLCVALLTLCAVASQALGGEPENKQPVVIAAVVSADQASIYIEGVNFGLAPQVFLSGAPLNGVLVNAAGTQIIANLPSYPPGSYPLTVSAGKLIGGLDITIGAVGLKGDTGDQGPPGEPGRQGDQGTPGDTGAVGATGATGANGSDGAPGARGDPGAGFTWRGVFVDDGAYNAGDAVSFEGSAWITNVAIPRAGEPPSGSWQLLAAQGAPGTNGSDGTNGTNGSDGTNGTNGSDGTNGTNGAQGPQGATGPTGPTGPAGTGGGGLPVSITLQFVSTTVNGGASGTTGGIGQFCPVNKIAIGGYLDSNNYSPSVWDVTYSHQSEDPRGWVVGYHIRPNFSVTFTFRTICLG